MLLQPLLLTAVLLASALEALSVPLSLTTTLQKRAIDDEFTEHGGTFNWYALGDSYTAGPGAGVYDQSNQDECYRSVGSYARQLSSDWLYTSNNDLNFLACTGAKTPEVIANQLPEISSDPQPDLAVMTIGGNDVFFSGIVKKCLVSSVLGDCDGVIADARAEWATQDFRDRLFKIYDGIFDQMPADFHHQVLHLGYSRFFNVDSGNDNEWCNSQSLNNPPAVPGYKGLLLTQALRIKLNTLVDDFNSKLWILTFAYANQKLSSGQWKINRLFFANLDGGGSVAGLFDGNRFCEQGVEDKYFADDRIWFFGIWKQHNEDKNQDQIVGASYFKQFDTNTCAQDPKYESDPAFAWDCDFAKLYAQPDWPQNVTTTEGAGRIKSMHPKTAGFQAIRDYIANELTTKIRKPIAQGTCIQAPQDVNVGSLYSAQPGWKGPASICNLGSGTFSTALGTATGSALGLPSTTAPASPTNSAPAPTSALVDPPALASCVPSPTAAVKDSHGSEMSRAADYFCSKYASATAVPTASPVKITGKIISGTVGSGRGARDIARDYTGTDNEDDVYDISVTSVDNCDPQAAFDLAVPLSDKKTEDCPTLLESAWSSCNNNAGRGGTIAAGCLKYTLNTVY